MILKVHQSLKIFYKVDPFIFGIVLKAKSSLLQDLENEKSFFG
jgi:hypothetical protein